MGGVFQMTYELHELNQAKKTFTSVLDAVAGSKFFQYNPKVRKDAVLHFKDSDAPFHMTYGFHSATIYKTEGE